MKDTNNKRPMKEERDENPSHRELKAISGKRDAASLLRFKPDLLPHLRRFKIDSKRFPEERAGH